MRQIELKGSEWTQPRHFYEALLPALGAPHWHGHNLDALNDSIFGGRINQVEPPFRIIVSGADRLAPPMREFLTRVGSIFAAGRMETGLEAYLEIEPPI
jgi:hypothetical protein